MEHTLQQKMNVKRVKIIHTIITTGVLVLSFCTKTSFPYVLLGKEERSFDPFSSSVTPSATASASTTETPSDLNWDHPPHHPHHHPHHHRHAPSHSHSIHPKFMKWSCFSGCPSEGESIEDAAAREALEESLGVLNFSSTNTSSETDSSHSFSEPLRTDTFQQKIKELSHSLKHGDYLYKIECYFHFPPTEQEMIDSKINVSDEEYKDTVFVIQKKKVCYVKQCHWKPSYPIMFERIREQIMSCHQKSLSQWSSLPHWLQNHPSLIKDYSTNRILVKKEFVEKHGLAYFSFPCLLESLQNNGRFKNFKFVKSFLSVFTAFIKALCKDINYTI